MPTHQKIKTSDGFTIVELLVVIVVIGVLAAIITVSYSGISQRAIVASVQSDLNNTVRLLKLDQIQSDSGDFPTSLDTVNGGVGVSASDDTTFRYSVDNNARPQSFCLSATKNTTTYKITDNTAPVEGDCQSFGLVLDLDAGDPASYPGSGTTWTDLSGNGHNGALVNGVGYTTEGDGALTFDGTDDYVTCGTIAPISSHTLASWVKIDNLSGGTADQTTYGFSIAATSTNYATWLSVGGNAGNEARMRAYTSNSVGINTTGSNLNTTDWFYIVATATKNSTAKVYVNGVERLSFTASSSDWAGTFTIGDLRPARLIGFDGSISQLQLYSRAMSSTEIQQNFDDQRSRYGL
jgi:prepilin-type N-terminal cleavage/methylation domain-containing protein